MQRVCRAYNKLGITGSSRQSATKLVTEAAEVASRWLWARTINLGLDQPRLGCPEKGVCPKHITHTTSLTMCHRMMYVKRNV